MIHAADISCNQLMTYTNAEVSVILRDAWEGFKRGFVLAYAGRAGLGVMTRALSLVRQRQFSDALGWRLLSEKTLVYRCACTATRVTAHPRDCEFTMIPSASGGSGARVEDS